MTDDGPLGEEVQRLLGTVQDWAQRMLPAPPSGHPGPECQWCPLCQVASVLRGEHPELAERLGEAGAAVTGALRALLDTAGRSRPGARPRPAAGPGAGSAGRPTPAPKVQRIDLGGPSSPPAGRGPERNGP